MREAGVYCLAPRNRGRAGGYGKRESPDPGWRVPLNPAAAQAGIKMGLPQAFAYAGAGERRTVQVCGSQLWG